MFCSHCGQKNPDITFWQPEGEKCRLVTCCCLAIPREGPPSVVHDPPVGRETFFEVAFGLPAHHPVCIKSNYYRTRGRDKKTGETIFRHFKMKKFPKDQQLPCIPSKECPASCSVYRRFLSYKKRIARKRETEICIVCGADIRHLDTRRTICENQACRKKRKEMRRLRKPMVNKECTICGNNFSSTNPDRQTCSRDCWQRLKELTRRKNYASKECLCCGKEWVPLKPEKLFCSKLCEKTYLEIELADT